MFEIYMAVVIALMVVGSSFGGVCAVLLFIFDTDKRGKCAIAILLCFLVFLPVTFCAIDGMNVKNHIRQCELENIISEDEHCDIIAVVINK